MNFAFYPDSPSAPVPPPIRIWGGENFAMISVLVIR